MAHVFVTKSQANDQTGAPITFDHTPAADATLAILSIVVGGTTGREGGAPTIDGVTATGDFLYARLGSGENNLATSTLKIFGSNTPDFP